MKRNTIKLTESQLHDLIKESVEQILSENLEDEGFWGNLGNQVTSAAKGMKNAVMNGGGVQGYRAGYYGSRANYMNGEQEQENKNITSQISAIDKQIEQLNAQKAKLQAQQQQQGQYAAQAQKYTDKANQAKADFRNAWGAAPQGQ